MTGYLIFSDASLNPKLEIGVGATLIIAESDWAHAVESFSFEIKTLRMKGETIARLEFLTAISALREWKRTYQRKTGPAKITLIIDCKAIENLLQRRERLEKHNFLSQKKGQILANADLYKAFLNLYDELVPEILWVKGHSPSATQNEIQKVFSLVDKTARKTLREQS